MSAVREPHTSARPPARAPKRRRADCSASGTTLELAGWFRQARADHSRQPSANSSECPPRRLRGGSSSAGTLQELFALAVEPDLQRLRLFLISHPSDSLKRSLFEGRRRTTVSNALNTVLVELMMFRGKSDARLTALCLLLEMAFQLSPRRAVEWLDASCQAGYTALAAAALSGHTDCVKCLILCGCDWLQADVYGNTPRQLAEDEGHSHIAELLEAVEAAPVLEQIPGLAMDPKPLEYQIKNTIARPDSHGTSPPLTDSLIGMWRGEWEGQVIRKLRHDCYAVDFPHLEPEEGSDTIHMTREQILTGLTDAQPNEQAEKAAPGRHINKLVDSLVRHDAPVVEREPMDLDVNAPILTADFFAGAGGFADAAGQTGALVGAFVENNPEPRAMYINTGWATEDKLLGQQGHIETVEPSEVPNVAMITGGFPCVNSSLCGKLEGFWNKTVGRLVFHLIYQVQHSKPPSALFENVSNLASIEYCGVSCLRLICWALERIGYYVVVLEIDARWAGVAQRRNRLYLSLFREKKWHDAFLRLLDDPTSPLRHSLRGYKLGVKDIIEPGITPLNSPHLFLSPGQICNRTWQDDEMHVLCVDSALPSQCITASYMSAGHHVTYLCPRTKAELGLPEDHNGKLTHSQYCDIGVRRFSDKELHTLMGFSKTIHWSSTRLQFARARALGNAVVPRVVAPLMATMFVALGFTTHTRCFQADTSCPQVDHSTTDRKGQTIHTFLPSAALGLLDEQELGWPEFQEGVEVRVFWPQYDEWYTGQIEKRSIEQRQASEYLAVQVYYPESDTWASHRLPLAGRWQIEAIQRSHLGLDEATPESASSNDGLTAATNDSVESEGANSARKRVKTGSSKLAKEGWEAAGNAFVGREIRKQFDGEWYTGRVTHWHPLSCWWYIEYDDGDKESIHSIGELRKMLIQTCST